MDIFNLENWAEETLQSLIDNNIEESAYLEFKRADALAKSDGKKDEIAKDVSAFANSDGGILIYGINEVDHKADSFDFIDGNDFNKEWLELVITTAISRKIDGIKIFPVRFNNEVKQTVYVIKIPVSYSAPHMVSRKKSFYKRYNFMAVAMEEYEIRQTYGRKENVKLEISMIAVQNETELYKGMMQIAFVMVQINIKNVSSRVAKEYKVGVELKDNKNVEFKMNTVESYNYTSLPDSVSLSTLSKESIYPNEQIRIMSFGLQALNKLPFNKEIEIILFIHTENETVFSKVPIRLKSGSIGLYSA